MKLGNHCRTAAVAAILLTILGVPPVAVADETSPREVVPTFNPSPSPSAAGSITGSRPDVETAVEQAPAMVPSPSAGGASGSPNRDDTGEDGATPPDPSATALVWLTGAPGSPSREPVSTIGPAVATGIPSAGWPGCGVFDDKFRVMKDYTRLRARSTMSGTYARLYCGIPTTEGSTSAFGYRHMKLGHELDWKNKAAYINRHWHDLAAWAISFTVKDPDRATAQTARYCYQRKFWLADQNGTIRSTMIVQVALGETGVRIMTAFPRNTGGCSGTQIWYARPS
ncbi:hypothetical protein [Microbacterium sp. SSM24]|uniref:hypothetical protein n=1 Tax=Microbacterium sp. SSM24 TaxID=2991714 RepID=UPI00222688B4|nr:hypothetical protein [Microbacterium sp. SSM24]MCW3493100.1 hypothetical protein [Microbacterium sp. SSM24]